MERVVMYEQVAQLTLEPNGLNRRDDILVIFFFSSFFGIVRHFRLSISFKQSLLRHSPFI